MQLSLQCDSKGAKQTEGRGRGFLCQLWNRVGVQNGHLVEGRSLSVCHVPAGQAVHCGSTGWWCGGGGAGSGAGASAAHSRHGRLLLFGLFTGELRNAEDKLEASQFDVAAVVEQGGALPTRPAATNQARAARLTAARRLDAITVRVAGHDATSQ